MGVLDWHYLITFLALHFGAVEVVCHCMRGGGEELRTPPSLLHFVVVVVVVVRALALLLLPLSLSFSFYSLLVLFLVVWRSLFVALFLVVVRGGKDLAASGAGVWKGTKNKRNEKTPNHCI